MRLIISSFLIILFQFCNAQDTLQKNIQIKLKEYFTAAARSKIFSGNIIVAKDDKILYKDSYGMANYEWGVPMEKDTKIKIASCTKTFTSAAILLLIKQNRLSLNTTIDKFIPDFPSAGKITIKYLLLHQSGVDNPDYSKLSFVHHLKPEDVLANLKSQPLLFEPGTNDQYSNGGYFLLAYIIEKVSGKSYGQFLKEYIFSPLHMNDTYVYEDEAIIPKRAAMYSPGPSNGIENTDWYSSEPSMGSGFLYSTAADLYKWCKAIKNKTLFDIWAEEYPYGWGRRKSKNGTRFITQTGYNEGHQAVWIVYESGYFVIFNSNFGNLFFNRVYDDVRNILFGGEYELPGEIKKVNVAEETLAKYTGEYKIEGNPNFKIILDKGNLYFQFVTSSFWNYLAPLTDNSFMNMAEFSVFKFKSDSKGEINGLTISFGKNEGPLCPKIKSN